MWTTIRSTAMIASLALTGGQTIADDQTLECRLYIAESMDHTSTYQVESASSMLESLRRGGLCVFADGDVADKQFVMGMNIRGDGSVGDAVGISVYTFESGDSLTLSFIGGWNKGPFEGNYTVLTGTGVYEGATGVGTISGVDGPWKSTSEVNIRLDLVLAENRSR